MAEHHEEDQAAKDLADAEEEGIPPQTWARRGVRHTGPIEFVALRT